MIRSLDRFTELHHCCGLSMATTEERHILQADAALGLFLVVLHVALGVIPPSVA